jgi:DNA modification methylase
MTRIEQFGGATLYLGDCREILPSLGALDAVVTDPPYGTAFQSNHRKQAYSRIQNDHGINELIWACRIKPRHSAYIFSRWDIVLMRPIPRPKSLITWVKNNWSMGDLTGEHARQTEICLFYPGPDHSFIGQRPVDVVFAMRTGNTFHPTEKPVDLMAQIVKWTAGVVIDPFMGSGSTGVACVKFGRAFIGIEIAQSYFDVACRRIEEATRQSELFPPETWDEMWSKRFEQQDLL